jgi:patatin-like phospholipase/acyl hydrolase
VTSSAATGRFQVLALDGGGARALFTAHVLARLEEDFGVAVADSFDLIAGTSAGGIVALALGAGLRPAQIVLRFRELVTDVFPAWRRQSPHRLFRPAYRADALRHALSGVLGDKLLGNSQKRLIVPSWNVQMGCVHVFKTPHHPRLRRDWRIPMVDVAMATSAAPSYFPAAVVDGQRLVDGGVWANNPSVIGISEAISMLGARADDIRVLNVGTLDALESHPKRLDRGGLLAWARPAAPLVVTAGSRGGQGTALHLVSRSNYHRFDARVPGGLYALDRVDPTDVAGIAASVSRELSPIFSDHFLEHVAPPYIPLTPASGETDSTQGTTS